MRRRRSWVVVLLCGLSWTTTAAGQIDFRNQVAPILEKHCLGCHSAALRKGDLSLATITDLKSNGYVNAGQPDESHLIAVLTPQNGQPPEMPREAPPLSAKDLKVLRKWIHEGAAWPDDVVLRELSRADTSWWSLQPLSDRHATDTGSETIDRLVRARLSEQGLKMNPRADRRSLIRRATYDLTGLPPTPEDVKAFVANDDPQAYEKLIDRLLASPRYGERWGRHWLDVVRFGESNGFERNIIINELWPFRDYVIDSLNVDKPFDRFIREHLVGDVIGRDQPDIEVGSAFLVAGPYDNVGNQDAVQAAQIRANTIDEMIRATSEAFLGLTIGCARCHDHKFDPILQRDYYSLYATFAGVFHGNRELGTAEQKALRSKRLAPLQQRKAAVEKRKQALNAAIQARGQARAAEFEKQWTRPAVSRLGTEETFPPVTARFVRLVCEAQDRHPRSRNFRIDEFEVWTADKDSMNAALASGGATATGASRRIEDFADAYAASLAIDGEFGARFISAGSELTIELPRATRINRVFFSSARNEPTPEHDKFVFVADYRIEVSVDGESWRQVAGGSDRQPVSDAHRHERWRKAVLTRDDEAQLGKLNRELKEVNRELAALPMLQKVWVGTRNAAAGKGPFHVFLGGSPQRRGDVVVPASLAAYSAEKDSRPRFVVAATASEADRRAALADWIVHPQNPLPQRVLANRVWHYHFGIGLVDSPSDFGYMGGRPTHPELLDWLAGRLREGGWKLKSLHKLIMLSETYRQSSEYRREAASVDGDSRLLWRFPPRRLSAEEIRDTMLAVSGRLNLKMGGPGFRLYKYLEDNVATYVPLDQHGPETYRRAVYHQNARASVVDLMTDFDQPDCAFATPRRAATTTPLQALTMLNHSFTLDMARALCERLERPAATGPDGQIRQAFRLCYSREPTDAELHACLTFRRQHGLEPLCRVLLNTGELIYLK